TSYYPIRANYMPSSQYINPISSGYPYFGQLRNQSPIVFQPIYNPYNFGSAPNPSQANVIHITNMVFISHLILVLMFLQKFNVKSLNVN
uniref:hypothetical protein n=1 Tax=Salmonella sp. s51228 TaxID=3159652 RepID=UPI00397F61AF